MSILNDSVAKSLALAVKNVMEKKVMCEACGKMHEGACSMSENTDYQKFFKKTLKKFGVTSPSQLDDAKKKEFYDYIDKNWQGKDEAPESNEESDKKLSGKKEKIEINPTISEKKVECPKCEGEGCDHCDDKGYHLDEANMSRVAKELEAYARKNGGIDKMDFMKAAMMMKKGQTAQLKKFVDDLDTDPRDKILSLMGKDADRRKEYKAAQKKMREEVELDEAKKGSYKLYHMTYTNAIQAAIKNAEDQGYEVDMDDYERKVSFGPRKPSSGKTNSFSIKLTKNDKPVRQALQIQVYNMDNKKYELNTYIS